MTNPVASPTIFAKNFLKIVFGVSVGVYGSSVECHFPVSGGSQVRSEAVSAGNGMFGGLRIRCGGFGVGWQEPVCPEVTGSAS